jgi:exodeoxyribonuclease V gamma subunit
MELIRSNRTEILADALASRVCDEPLGPFETEAIVVQSLGMERWLTLALAERLGIWSNPSFPFPRAVIEQLLGNLLAGSSDQAKAYEPGRLKWTLAELLRESAPTDLRSYLGEPLNTDRLLQLAHGLSEVFDRYVVYRPDLVKRWNAGEEMCWQADLWRRVVNRLGPHDLASRIEMALPALRAGRGGDRLKLRRLHLFSLETLPPLFLQFFADLSLSIPTTLYLLEPCSEHVGEVGLATQLSLPLPTQGEAEHPLVSNLGRLSRDFQQLLLTVDDRVRRRSDLFEAPARQRLLTSLQADLLEIRGLPDRGCRPSIDPSDRSISIHACAGPMREAQLIRDLICAALEDDHSLQPEDVVVMTPDLETYAPAFRAVFGQDEAPRIPFEVHDRKTRDDVSFYDELLALLGVLDSRFSVLDLVRLMDSGAMRSEFRFTPHERTRLADLLSAAGVRWGIDGKHRAELEFPEEDMHTWRAGLGRLFLGFASMPQAMEAFEGLLPRGELSLGDAELVARLSRLCEVLFDFRACIWKPLGVSAWTDQVEQLSRLVFSGEDSRSNAARILEAALHEIRDRAERGGFTGTISLKTLRRELRSLLLVETPAAGFLHRGVTLTELVPLRSVPFRVVCLIGMGEDCFPRGDDRPSFDLTRQERRPGDRNQREDDRHCFMQALLCARDRLIVTYSAPPSGLRIGASSSPIVWELTETVNRYYQGGDGQPVLETTVHPTHPFDSRYFDRSGLPQSYSQRYLSIACGAAEPRVDRSKIELRAEPRTGAAAPEGAISVGELASWLWNPTAAFIDRVLRARFDDSELYEPTGALTTLGALEASRVGNGALRAGLRGKPLEDYLAAAPELPDGNWGALQRRRLAREVDAVSDLGRRLQGEHEARAELVAADLDRVVLEGRLDGLCPGQRIVRRFTKPGRRAELAVWIEHLLMQAVGGSTLPHTTHLVLRGTEARASLVSFRSVADPRHELDELLALYDASKEAPLPLLETASWTFAERREREGRDKAILAAKSELGKQRRWDQRLAYVLGRDDPFEDAGWADAFETAALACYGPLLAHRSVR